MGRTRVYHISYHSAIKSVSLMFYGCNFSCKGCLRRVFLYDCHLTQKVPEKAEIKFLSVDETVNLLKRVHLRSVVFEGGEPTLDPRLAELAEAISNELNVYTLLLTNGHIFPPLNSFDEVKVSIKAYTKGLHRDYTGVSNERVLKNFRKIYEENAVKLSAETVLIPNYIDVYEIEKIAKFIASVDPSIPLRIDAYWDVVHDAPWRRAAPEDVTKAARVARRYLRNVTYLHGGETTIGDVISLWPKPC